MDNDGDIRKGSYEGKIFGNFRYQSRNANFVWSADVSIRACLKRNYRKLW